MEIRRILLVENRTDDESRVKAILSKNLPESEIETARSSASLLLMAGQKFDLVIADLTMPDEQEPFDVILQIEKQFQDTPIIIWSDIDKIDFATDAIKEANVVGYFSKSLPDNWKKFPQLIRDSMVIGREVMCG